MFPLEKRPLLGELSVDGPVDLSDCHEFLRFWVSSEGNYPTCFINPRALGPDPFLFGMVLVDAVRHAAKAYAGVINLSEEKALDRIWAGLDAERGQPTTGIDVVQGSD